MTMSLLDKYPTFFSVIIVLAVLTISFYLGKLIIKVFKVKASDKDLAGLLIILLILYYIFSGFLR